MRRSLAPPAQRALPAPSTLLALLTCVWLLFLLAAPVEAAGTTLSAMAYALGSFICHQQPDRSFHLGAAQIPVCARCVGLYAGAALGAVLCLPAAHALRVREANRTGALGRRVLIGAALPTLLTWGIEALGIAHPSNIVRAVAALPLGIAAAVVVGAAASGRLR